jgi:Tol biopolymer transport system component
MGYVKVFSIGKQLLEIGLFLLLAIIVVGSLKTRKGFVVQAGQESSEKTRSEVTLPPLEDDATLFFVSTDIPSLLAAQVKKSGASTSLLPEVTSTKRLRSWVEESTQKGEEEDKKSSEFGHDGHITVGKLFPSPDRRQIAVQVYMGSVPVVWTLDLQDREHPTLKRLTTQGLGFFLGWHPKGQHALVKMLDMEITDPGLWLVDTYDGTHKHIEIPKLVAPEGLMAAAISPDGSKIAYSITRGIGFGSEIWRTDINGTNHTLIREDQLTVSLSWSYDGSKIAFMNLVDSPVPFAAAGLWSMNSDGTNQQFLTTMDGGHGQTPLWSKDGQKLFFIARDNLDDVNADYESETLVSSIRSIDVDTHEESVLVPANGARQIDLSLTSDGNLLFVSNRQGTDISKVTSEGQNRTIDSSISTNQIYLPIITGNFGNLRGILEVWTVSPRGELQRLSADGEAKRHPVLVPYIDQS